MFLLPACVTTDRKKIRLSSFMMMGVMMRRSYVYILGALLLLPLESFAGYKVSSFRKDARQGANFWSAASGMDEKPETCWMTDPEKDNARQWFEIDVPVSTVDKLAVMVGWEKDDGTFYDYARLKSAQVEIYDFGDDTQATRVATADVEFEDKRGWQIVELPDTKVGGEILGGRVRLTVKDTYPGKDFPSLAISEILIHLTEFEVPAYTVVQETGTAQSGHEADMLFDGSSRTYWAANASSDPIRLLVETAAYGMSSVGLSHGPKTHARPKTIRVNSSDNILEYTMADKSGVQWFRVPAMIGYTGSAWSRITVEIVDYYPGSSGSNAVSLTEIKLNATNVDDF